MRFRNKETRSVVVVDEVTAAELGSEWEPDADEKPKRTRAASK
ncbi:hypothetical protein [Rathayibacter sp. AY2B9]|jgi:hypothetical protein|nr:hypothetical protein [Rathayibacter sp. AY2B9]